MEEEAAFMESEALKRIKSSWVLRPTQPLKTRPCGLRRKATWILVGVVIAVVLTARLATLSPHQHKEEQTPTPDEYLVPLRKALTFFNAQRSGHLPEVNGVPWRSDSGLQDGSSHSHLVGGYYDGGDAIKTSFTMSFATLLSWSVIEYSSKYESAAELRHVQEVIRWGTDYFLESFDSNADTLNEMVSQIGSGASAGPNDRYCWMRPEDIDYPRPVTRCFTDCSDLAAEMAAALASASIVLKDDKEYSQKLLRGAKALYKFAESMSSTRSTSGEYWDELIWGGAWLYYATGDLGILDRVTSPALAARASAASSNDGVLGWDTKLAGAQLLLTRLRVFLRPGYPYEETLSDFHNQIGVVMCSYLPYFNKFNRTKGGLIQLNHGDPQVLQYAANAAFLAVLYGDYLDAADVPGWYCGPSFYSTRVLREFARSQVDYILGKNPPNMSYVVGFGERYPKHVHHRGASIPSNRKESCEGGWKWKESSNENPNTIQGAMVAGPDEEDGFQDLRTNPNYTEPTLAGNAGLVAALVALSGEAKVFDKNTLFSAIPPPYPEAPPPPAPWTP
ncbi:unnamed protein product [Thlaspi arvense]|uniref:Endoglucanase n=1 Tax=Thlaspi arvense TaxID=13288 RepID=A0AAU9RWQ2_THLAR|nr:unnamed protein product [Thlaspi arvense]